MNKRIYSHDKREGNTKNGKKKKGSGGENGSNKYESGSSIYNEVDRHSERRVK